VDTTVLIPGMNSFSTPPVHISSFTMLNSSGAANSVNVEVGVDLWNPSPIGGSMGPVAMALGYGGFSLSSAQVTNLQVAPGFNRIVARGDFIMPNAVTQPGAHAAAIDMISRYVENKTSTLQLVGTANSSASPILQPAMAAFNISAGFPGLAYTLVENGTLQLDIPSMFGPDPKANISLAILNPLPGMGVELLNASLTAYMCRNQSTDAATGGPRCLVEYGPAIGNFYKGDLSKIPFVAAPLVISVSRFYAIDIDVLSLGSDVTLMLELLQSGAAVAKLNGTMTAGVGRFAVADDGTPYLEDPLILDFPFEGTGVPVYLE